MKNKVLYIIFLCISTLFISSCGLQDNRDTNGGDTPPTQWEEMENPFSTRHQEWVEVNNNGKIVYSWVVYPEVSENSSVVILIHENRWLTDWVRSTADRLAGEGYIVVAPDLLSSYDENHKRTSDFRTTDDATQAINTLSEEGVMSDLNSVIAYAKTIPASNWNLVSIGFCWGWAQSYLLATQSDDLQAALVFYWTPPSDEASYENINAPVFWFYWWNDNRVTSTVENTQSLMNRYNKVFHYEIYEWAGHAFMRIWEEENASIENIQAKERSWERMLNILDDVATWNLNSEIQQSEEVEDFSQIEQSEEDSSSSSQPQEIKEFYVESYVNMMNWIPAPRFSLSEIQVNVWDKVHLKIKATSWIHNFKLDEYDIFVDTPTGEEVVVEFVADNAWEFIYYCNMPWHRESGHWGTLIVNP